MEQRWRGRRALSALVRVAVFTMPLAASMAAGALVSRTLPRPEGAVAVTAWWVVVLGTVTIVMVVVERAARRLLPLAALLRLSLIFPDQAPSRFRMAVRAGGTRRLEQHLRDAAEAGLPDAPAEAAEKVLELAALLNVHDRRTRGHSERVRVYADLLAEELSLSADDRSRLHWAALLHDIGKLVVPSHILNKDGEPDATEWEVLRRHPLEGERFVEPLRGWLGGWAAAIGEHHERYDGGGYPRGLAGQEISLAARIVAVADSYEVMTAVRAYKKPVPAAEARRELARCAGSQFDPVVVRAFLHISLGRLRFAMGPLAWLAQIPVVSQAPAALGSAASAAGSAAAGAVASTAIVLGGVVHAPPAQLAPALPATATTEVRPPSSTAVAAPLAPLPSVAPGPQDPDAAVAATVAPGSSVPGNEPGDPLAPAPTPTTVTGAPTAQPATAATAPAPVTSATAPPATDAPPTTTPPRAPNDREVDPDQGRGNDGRPDTSVGTAPPVAPAPTVATGPGAGGQSAETGALARP